jgi:molybdopterin synthase sulfur carrier subunit
MIRVLLPALLRDMIGAQGEVLVNAASPVTQRSAIDAIEAQYPMLRGTLREGPAGKRRSLVRFYACGEDLSFEPPESVLPDAVARGMEPYLVVGAIAGG